MGDYEGGGTQRPPGAHLNPTVGPKIMHPFEIIHIAYQGIVIYAVALGVMFYLRSLKQRRVSRSLEYIQRWNSSDFRHLTDRLGADVSAGKSLRDLAEELSMTESSEIRAQLRGAWDFFEEVAIAVLFREANDDVLREFFYYNFSAVFKLSERHIHQARERSGNRGLYVNMERLYGKWGFGREYSFQAVTR